MDTIAYIKERYEALAASHKGAGLEGIRQQAFNDFSQWGIPTTRHEEWKYTRIGSEFNKDFTLSLGEAAPSLTAADVDGVRLPGHEGATELVFVNGIFTPALSTMRAQALKVLPLEEAATGEQRDIVARYLGDSRAYQRDGIMALNTAFLQGGAFVQVPRGKVIDTPVYIYHIVDARTQNVLAQPRTLVHIGEAAQVEFVETVITLGRSESFTNAVVEVIVEKEAIAAYYKIQADADHASQVSTTHIRQVGKSYVHTVTISLGGATVRNNLNMVMAAANSESHLYGIYFPTGRTLVDNHTVVDNVEPGCYSNEFYKGILDGDATGVFNGKIFVRPDAQKTNAYQSNKNILLSDGASVNTKPQLEIWADDVKCSHGCTVGRLDEESMFYMQSRGISETTARGLLLHAFAIDILEHIKPAPIREYVDRLISERLQLEEIL